MRRGINFGDVLDLADERHFDVVRDAGFDTVRLPVAWSAHMPAAGPMRLTPTLRAGRRAPVAPATDDRMTVTVRYNSPFRFTHQSAAGWLEGAEGWPRTGWGDEAALTGAGA